MEKEKDVFTIEMFGVKNEVKLEYASYNCNGTMALQLFCKVDPEDLEYYGPLGDSQDLYQIPYGIATVNLPESELLEPDVQFVDENNLPGIGKWLQKNGIASPDNIIACSGYCSYQAYKFNVPEKAMEKIIAARTERASLPVRKENAAERPQRRM